MSHTTEIRNTSFHMILTPIKDNIIRCTYSCKEIRECDSLIIDKRVRAGQTVETASVMIGDRKSESKRTGELEANSLDPTVIASTKRLLAKADPETGAVTWYKADGRLLLQEAAKEFLEIPVEVYTTGGEAPIVDRVKTVDGERNFIRNLQKVTDHYAWQGRLYFSFGDDEGIYGLGQAEDGVWNYRHHTHYMYQHNMRIPMPMFVSDKGYGILFDCTSLMTFNDTEAGSYMFFDTIEQLDYYFVAGDCMDEIIAGFRYLTGDASMLPKWAYGYVQSKEQYYSAAEMAAVVRNYRERKVPIDCIVQDWNSWPEGQWGQKSLDPTRYGEVKERMQEIHDMHVHTMVSVWPNMNTGTPNHTELSEQGFMLNDLATYDAFDEKAREIYWKQAAEGLYEQGFDSWWCDSTEPFSGPDWGGEIKREPWVRYQMVGTEHRKYLPAEKANAYALMHAKGMFENQKKDHPDKRMLNLTRSGYASGQKYGAMLWSGDITGSWDTMKKQIAEGMNVALSGYPYWTLDIGGFFTVGKEWTRRGCGCDTDPTPKWFWKGIYDDGVKDKGYCELYTRWIQMGCFLPMFRSHGTDTPREIWNFGEPGTMFYDAIEKYIKLRYRLMPYIYSMAGAVRLRQFTIMRSLLFDFAQDPKASDIKTEFMFGKNLLICPVLKPMYYENKSREISTDRKATCYLPAGSGWYDFYTDEYYEGGQEVTVDSPIDRMPIFVKAGSILPMEKELQYASEIPETAMELHVYPGADAEFTLYEDNGEDYSYEEGAYALTGLRWNESEGRLVINARKGSYPGMTAEREYEIIVHDRK